ncbi:hemicentin-2-like isoform X1 [Lineus longissimus]|uniref:hemicentin-2-like isoform X1 n=1 Tax=Lineus longissimus TaxID=88925 RepID=UPI00315DF384
MENGVALFLVTLLVTTQTALTGGNYQNDITVQPGPVRVKQGQNVSLWCKLKYDPHKKVPIIWHTPPNFKTRTNDCSSFAKDKYVMSCSVTDDHFGYYNITIMDVQWVDNGVYRCLYINHMDIVDLQVLVPVTDVSLKKVVKSSAVEPQRLHEYFTCTTNCAFPAPKISWLVNDQPFNANARVIEYGCFGAKEGQKRTESRVRVMSAGMDKERTEYNISCTAENVVGEPTLSKAITVNNVVPVTDVTLEKIVKSTAAEPQRLHEYFACTTNCAFPPPKISWLVNDQLFNGIPTVNELDCYWPKDSQKQTISTVLVRRTDTDKESTEYNVTCTAENVVGEPNVSETMSVNNDALTGANYQNDITVQPGPVEVKQGQTVSLWCKLKYDRDKIVPVNWQTPPKFQTRTDDCSSFAKDKYAMSCSDARHHFRYYNMTIMDVQWADKGEYRCMYTNHMDIVDLQVLVPVTDVTPEQIVKSSAAEPQRVHEYFACTTNCAFPAPKISWRVNDQPFNGNTTVRELGCLGAKEGQKQTMSTVFVIRTGMDKESTEYNITCTAENVVGEPNVSEAMAVNNDVFRPVTPSPPQSIMAKAFWPIVATTLFLLLVTAISIFIAVYGRHRRQCNKRSLSNQSTLLAE